MDQVFFVNAAVDLLLLKTAVSLTGAGARPWRLWAGAAFGGLAAVLVLTPGFRWTGRLPGAGLVYLGLCLICFGCRGRAWKSWLWFLCVCCGFAGLVLGACGLLGVPAVSLRGRVWYGVTGRLLVLLAALVYGACRLLLDRFALHRGRELATLELGLGNRSLTCAALVDTGNTLTDPLTGERVLVARWQVGARLLPELGLNREAFRDPGALALRLAGERPQLGTRLIPYRAVGTEGGLLLALRLDRVLQDGRPSQSRLVAFSPTELSDGGGYEALTRE